jgi:hypothetical protein
MTSEIETNYNPLPLFYRGKGLDNKIAGSLNGERRGGRSMHSNFNVDYSISYGIMPFIAAVFIASLNPGLNTI